MIFGSERGLDMVQESGYGVSDLENFWARLPNNNPQNGIYDALVLDPAC
jgi:hypothetical protein